MEVGEAGLRQSGIASGPKHDAFDYSRLSLQHLHHQNQHQNHHHQQSLPRDAPARQYREPHNMATAALISPTAPYPGHHHHHHGHHPTFSPTYGPHASSIAGIISPIEPRRPADEAAAADHNLQQSRQSLPSISEVISGAKQGAYQHQPPQQQQHQPPQHQQHQHPPTAPTSVPSVTSSTFPSPFSATPRGFAEATTAQQQHDGRTSPQALHPLPPSAFAPRAPEPSSSSYTGSSPRPPYSARPDLHGAPPRPPSISGFTPPHQSPPIDHHHAKPGEQPQSGGGSLPGSSHSSHAPAAPIPPPPPPAPSSHTPYPHSAPLPAGQMPLPRYPISPQYHMQVPATPYETVHQHDQGYPQRRYDAAVGRHLEAWGYPDALMRVASSSRTIYNFAEAFSRIAQEQQSAQPILERLPSEREISEMINNADWIRKSLESVRDLVQYTTINERSREAKGKGLYEEEQDITMYDAMKNTFSIPEVKKRRGRAAPPGRCHSCNRIDTPEWRRGPDGARTLCNACGLHYAKLERKRQLDARNGIRPKPADENH